MLLDTFLILFEADTGKLDAGLDRSEQKSDELVDTLKKADTQASKTGQAFAGFAVKALGALTAALSAGSVISSSLARAQEITGIANTADALGLAVEELDAFGRAAQAAGGDAQGARDSLTDMAETIGEALQDVESQRAKTFAGLGVSLRDVNGNAINAVEGILRLSNSVQGLSREEAIFRIKELGITDNKTVEMVLRGRKELERMLAVQKDQGVITKENAEEARKFTESMNRLRGSLDVASTGFMSSLIPALTVGVEWLTKIVDWASEHSDVIVGFFGAIAAVVTALYLPAMISAAAATLAATWPIIAIAAVVTAVAAAFALAYEDIMNFIDGNDSLIGQIFEKYPLVKDVVFGIMDAFKLMWNVVSGIFNMMLTGFKQIVDFIMRGVGQITGAIGKVAGFFGFGGSDAMQEGQRQVAAASASPLNSTTSNAISNTVASTNKTNSVSIQNLNIETQATDPNGVADAVGGGLNAQLEQMDNEFASGVDR